MFRLEDQGNPDFVLTEDQLDALARGFGDGATIQMLREGEHSRFLQALASILDIASKDQTSAAVALIDEAQALDEPAAFEILSYPHVAVWGAVCLEHLMGLSVDGSPVDHLGHLSAVAAAVAINAGVPDFSISVPLREGSVTLPGLGRVVCGPRELSGRAFVESHSGSVAVKVRGDTRVFPLEVAHETDFWQPIRRVEVEAHELRLVLSIDDVDPYREFHSASNLAPPVDRLDQVGFKTWVEVITDAWLWLTEYQHECAVSIAHGLRVLVPVAEYVNPDHNRSPDAFGAVALSTVDFRWTALSLLQEFQSTKLTALNYLFPLHGATHDEPRYFGAWDMAPISLRSLFEHRYASEAMGDFWSAAARTEHEPARVVEAQMFAVLSRSRADYALLEVLESGELTAFGRQFIERLPALPPVLTVPPEAHAFARWTENDNRLCWRLRNLQPEKADVERLLAKFMAVVPCPALSVSPRISFAGTVNGWRARRWLGLCRVGDANDFSELRTAPAYLYARRPDASPLDVALIADDVALVERESRLRLEIEPSDLEAWARLTLAFVDRHHPAAPAFDRVPELVRALYLALVERGAFVDPVDVAHWLMPLALQSGAGPFLPAVVKGSPLR